MSLSYIIYEVVMNYKSVIYSTVKGFKIVERVLDLSEEDVIEHVQNIINAILEINIKENNSRQIKSGSEINHKHDERIRI